MNFGDFSGKAIDILRLFNFSFIFRIIDRSVSWFLFGAIVSIYLLFGAFISIYLLRLQIILVSSQIIDDLLHL